MAHSFEQLQDVVEQASSLIRTVNVESSEQERSSKEITGFIEQRGKLLQDSQNQPGETVNQSKELENLSTQFNQQLKRLA